MRPPTAQLLWTVAYPAAGQLDYDNMPRATPLIHEEPRLLARRVWRSHVCRFGNGRSDLADESLDEFDGDPELVWGMCSSPLVVDGKLIVNPGGPEASVVALDPHSGELFWQSPGDRHAYSSFIVATLGGVRQLVGYDRTSLGGWDIATGHRLWTLKPPHDGDFNVPTPVAVSGRLLVATRKQSRTRSTTFDDAGQIVPEPVATNDQLAPDISSPVVVGNRAFCVCRRHVLSGSGQRPAADLDRRRQSF